MAKRMKLVTEAEYQRLLNLRSHPVPRQLEESSFIEKELEASNLLHLNSLPDDIKLALYGSVLKNVNDKLSELQNKPTTVILSGHNQSSKSDEISRFLETNTATSNELSPDDEFLLGNLPDTFQPSARKIIEYLKPNPDLISWLPTGQCRIHGELVDGTNIVDLLSYILRSNLKIGEPVGTKRFLYILRVLNVPISILGHKRRSELKRPLDDLKRRQTERHNSEGSTSWESFKDDTPNRTIDLD